MSVIPPSYNHTLQFYLSGPMPCPYLPDRVERKLFTRLTGDHAADAEINGALTRSGFRRSHDVIYRPACVSCSACIPVRIPVHLFEPSRSLRRIDAHNRDLHIEAHPSKATAELYALFNAYEKVRHADSDMAQMSYEDFRFMLEEGTVDTVLYQLRDADNKLWGCVMTDNVSDGYSAVYSFFDPTAPKRSLGVQLILTLISEAERNNQPFVYLGYWIAASRKMSYKARFHPLQALGPHGWDWVKTADDDSKKTDEMTAQTTPPITTSESSE